MRVAWPADPVASRPRCGLRGPRTAGDAPLIGDAGCEEEGRVCWAARGRVPTSPGPRSSSGLCGSRPVAVAVPVFSGAWEAPGSLLERRRHPRSGGRAGGGVATAVCHLRNWPGAVQCDPWGGPRASNVDAHPHPALLSLRAAEAPTGKPGPTRRLVFAEGQGRGSGSREPAVQRQQTRPCSATPARRLSFRLSFRLSAWG